MTITSLGLFRKGFCMMILSFLTVCGMHSASQAKGPESQTKETSLPTASRVIVINPETGEIDPSAKTVPPQFTQESAQQLTAEETVTHRTDGSLSFDFKGKFMKPVYGYVDQEGKVVISHEQEKK